MPLRQCTGEKSRKLESLMTRVRPQQQRRQRQRRKSSSYESSSCSESSSSNSRRQQQWWQKRAHRVSIRGDGLEHNKRKLKNSARRWRQQQQQQRKFATAAVVASKHENNVLLIPSSQHQRIWTREKSERGRIDSKALQVHYGGEGSKSVRIKEAKV